jgi:hypothetical protein
MVNNKKSLFFVNTLGALGYISTLTQWMWALLIVAYPLLTTGSMWSLPESSAVASQPTTFVPTGPLAVVFAALITLIVIVIAIYTIFLVPHSVGKAGAKVTRNVASAAIPIITHHKKISRTQSRKLSYRIILILKLISALLPAVLIVILPSVAPIDQSAAVGAGIFLSVATCGYFTIQYLLGYLLKVDKASIW